MLHLQIIVDWSVKYATLYDPVMERLSEALRKQLLNRMRSNLSDHCGSLVVAPEGLERSGMVIALEKRGESDAE